MYWLTLFPSLELSGTLLPKETNIHIGSLFFLFCFVFVFETWSHSLVQASLGPTVIFLSRCQNTVQEWSLENFQCVWENSKKTRVLWLQFLQHTDLFLDCSFFSTQTWSWTVFHAPPRCSRWEGVYFSCCYSRLSMGKHVFAMCFWSLWLYSLLTGLLTLRV